MNEPGSGFWNGSSQQEGMGVPAGFFQNGLINEFAAQIRNRGTNIKLAGLEETSTSNSATSWTNASLTDTAKSNLKQVNTHSYGFNGGSTQTDSVNLFNAVNADNLGLKIYATEYGTGSGAVRMAEQINSDIRHLDAPGWTYWQAIEDNNGSGWGLAIANFNGNNNSFDVQDQYFGYKQFSSYIRPGSEILELSGQNNITAAYDPRTGITALVVTNDGADGTSQNYSFNLDRGVTSTRLIRTSDENNAVLKNAYQSLGAATVSGTNVSIDAAGNAITTLAVHHRPNLVQNPNFNLGGAANGAASIPNWQSQGNAKFDTGRNLSTDTSGTGRLETGGSGNSGRLFQTGIGGRETDLTGKAFQLSADLAFLNLGSRNYDADTYLALEFYGADDQTLASTSLNAYQTEIKPAFAMKGAGSESSVVGSAPNDSEYRTYRSGRFVAPAGTRYVRPVIRFQNAAGTDFTYIDNVYLGEVHPEADAREWKAEGGGTWSDTDNWSNNASVKKNSHAYFGNAIDQASDVLVTDRQSMDRLTFFSDHAYRLRASGANGRLEIGNAGSGLDAEIDTRWGSHRISIATTLFSDLEIQVLPDANLQFDNGFDANGREVLKLGGGMVNFALGFDLNGGTLAAYASRTATITLGWDAVLDGYYKLLLAPGQLLGLGDAFELAAYSSLNDRFDNFILPPLSQGLAWNVNYGTGALTASIVSAVPEPGSFCLLPASLIGFCRHRRRRTVRSS